MSLYSTVRWKRVRALVLRRDKYVCHWCKGKATEADHLCSLKEGGRPYDPGNLVAACKPCNSSRGAEVAKAREIGVFLGARRALHPHLPLSESLHRSVVHGAIRV